MSDLSEDVQLRLLKTRHCPEIRDYGCRLNGKRSDHALVAIVERSQRAGQRSVGVFDDRRINSRGEVVELDCAWPAQIGQELQARKRTVCSR